MGNEFKETKTEERIAEQNKEDNNQAELTELSEISNKKNAEDIHVLDNKSDMTDVKEIKVEEIIKEEDIIEEKLVEDEYKSITEKYNIKREEETKETKEQGSIFLTEMITGDSTKRMSTEETIVEES